MGIFDRWLEVRSHWKLGVQRPVDGAARRASLPETVKLALPSKSRAFALTSEFVDDFHCEVAAAPTPYETAVPTKVGDVRGVDVHVTDPWPGPEPARELTEVGG